MAITFVNAGTAGVGTTSVTAGDPASMATGNGIIEVVVTKPSTATFTTPTQWTTIGQNSGGAGSQGVDTGPSRVGAYFREKDANWTNMPAQAVGNSPNSSAAMGFRFAKASNTNWAFENRNGTYNTGAVGTALNVTTTAVDLLPGDWVLTAISNQVDTATWSAQSYTASGITFSAITEFSDVILATTGQDVGGAFWGAEVTAGSGSVTVQQQATASANSTGAVVFVRLREVPRPYSIRTSNPALARSYSW